MLKTNGGDTSTGSATATKRWLMLPRRWTRLVVVIIGAVLLLMLFIHIDKSLSTEASSSNIYRHLLHTMDGSRLEALKITGDKNLNLIDYDRTHIKYIYPEVIDAVYENTDLDSVNWSKYAYVLYATSSSHVCNAMMIFSELRTFKTKAQLVLLVRKEFLLDKKNHAEEYNTLTGFAKNFNIVLKPIDVIQIESKDNKKENVWMSSFTKLMVFNETQYDRIIYMDADAILTRGNLDELFFLPPAKLACPASYWLTRSNLQKQKDKHKYIPERYGWEPTTAEQRLNKLNDLIKSKISTFIDPATGRLPIFNYLKRNKLDYRINERNFFNNLYNSLPDYITLDEFMLTNIIMVIQPSADLFHRVQEAITARKDHDFDMDIIYRLFALKEMVRLQLRNTQNSLKVESKLENDIPEFLILPPQQYGTLTGELNKDLDHYSYLADSHEQVFALQRIPMKSGEPAYYETDHIDSPAKYFYPKIKYLHFSDSPIPKPWFKQRKDAKYMNARLRCESHPDFQKQGIVQPKGKTRDCLAGELWENAHKNFQQIRRDICHLEPIDTKENTYHDFIN